MQINLNIYKPVSYRTQYYPSFTKMYGESNINKNQSIAETSKTLDRNSDACKFFGVTSRDAINDRFYTQTFFSRLKCRDYNIMESLGLFNIDSIPALLSARKNLWETDKIKKLWDKGASRFTFSGSQFGKDSQGYNGVHTVGLVVDKKTRTLFILDSLSDSDSYVADYRKKMENFLFKSPKDDDRFKFDRIIFSTKYQQNDDEYTCNNWTHANIEALQKELKNGKKITTSEELNEVLPDNINNILVEQKDYLLKNIPSDYMRFIYC